MFKRIAFGAALFVGLCFCGARSLVYASDITVLDDSCYDAIADATDVSRGDISSYKKVFEAIRSEDFVTADELSAEIENDVLMGHVKAEKYLSATYVSSYDELKDWLENYGDHPQARKIYGMATRKGKAAGLVNPYNRFDIGQKFFSPYSWFNEDYEKNNPENAKYLRGKVKEFRKNINNGKTKKAKALLEDATFRKKMPNKNYDAMSATLALVYLLDNEDKFAITWAEKASKRSNDMTANWVGGLASWRSKKYEAAAKYFAKLGGTKGGDEWLTAAGSYWAYRSYDKLKNKAKAEEMLQSASKNSRTFYGILANYKLGNEIQYNWSNVSYYNDFSKRDYVNEMLGSESLKRAVLLIKAKNPELAEKDIDANYNNMTDTQKEVALYLTQEYQMRALGIKLALCLRNNDKSVQYDDAAYPLPSWEPKDGWKLDNSLVWAFVHQESRFQPEVMSGAGAKGLMQIMPMTARHILQTKEKVGDDVLLDAEQNLAMGQQYISYLLSKPYIDGNLFFLATAYNAGPGNLLKWEKKMNYNDDPLLFIEVLPARETRLYIKRVLANYWIYNARLDNDNYTLKQVSKGEYPVLEKPSSGLWDSVLSAFD